MNTIEETIKLAGWGKRKAMKKQIELFEKSLHNDEELLAAGASQPNSTSQIYVTNKRVIIHKIEGVFSNSKKEIPINSISSVSISTGLLGGTIQITASNSIAEIEKIPIVLLNEIKNVIDGLVHK